MSDTLVRQWTILSLIPRAPRRIGTVALQARLAARGVAIDLRTVQRDLNRLSRIFPLLCDGRGRSFGWSWSGDGEPFGVSGAAPSDALPLLMRGEGLPPILPPPVEAALAPHVQRAREVVRGGGDPRLLVWSDKVRSLAPGPARLGPHTDGAVRQVVLQGLFEDRWIEVDYRARNARRSRTHTVCPLGLVVRGRAEHLVVRDTGEPWQLLLHRCTAARLLDLRFERPDDFDLDTYIAGGSLGYRLDPSPIDLVLRLAPEIAPAVIEAPLSIDQRVTTEPDGQVRVEARVMETMELFGWLLSQGALLEVVSPAALRSWVAETAEAVARRHRAR
ncbi:MAG: WYL domain-containing protein [Myxococcales bacterium]|nr:WYL domain-containing protein [Myxococcales bacterium]